ncbi:MAG: hypothetical protein ABSA59_00935 [Terriglobia bacterium]
MESKPSGPAAVVLNDFAAAGDRVISLRHWESFVWELMLYSLLREEVLIQDEALVLSEKFARAFSPRPRGRILDELFDIGSLVVLKYPREAYPDPDLQERSVKFPMEARSQYIQRHTTRGAKLFSPTQDQLQICGHLDRILKDRPSAHRETGEHSTINVFDVFSERMVKVLSDRRYRSWLLAAFPGTTERMLCEFATYAAEPDEAIRRIFEKCKTARPDPQGRFTRSIAYQVAETYGKRQARAMQAVIQTVFAYVFDQRERAIGRYSSVLREMLLLSGDSADENDTLPIITIDAEVRIPLYLPRVQPGFSAIIREIREGNEGKRLRAAVRLRDTRAFEEQCDAWKAVAALLARKAVPSKPCKVVGILASIPYTKMLMTAFIVETAYWLGNPPLTPEFWKCFAGKRAIALGISIAGDFYRRITAHWYERQELRSMLEDAVNFRCTDLTA